MQSFFTAIRHILPIGAIAAFTLASLVPAQAADTYKWTVQYIVDNSQLVQGQSQKIWPRRNRGLAISPDGKFLYAGYHHGGNGEGEVRKIAIGETEDYSRATPRVLRGPLGKAIATDDKGRVIIANEGEVLIYDADLSNLQFSFQHTLCEGVATVREGKDLILYTTDRQIGSVRRWVMEEKDGEIVNVVPANSFGENGELIIKNAGSLRGIEVDKQGRMWVADTTGGRVYRISKDGKNVESVELSSPMDIGLDGDRAYVSLSGERQIAVLEMESIKLLGNLSVPWNELELSPVGNNRKGALSGIAIAPGKGFFVSNESGQTADQKSTYGKPDSHTDMLNGKLYKDAFVDDNDPILRALSVSDAK
jgi:hypothetical protein